jgi:hypothetical protein
MFKMHFKTDNAAFSDDCPAEVARILREIAAKIDGPHGRFYSANVRDVNGNAIGKVEFDGGR